MKLESNRRKLGAWPQENVSAAPSRTPGNALFEPQNIVHRCLFAENDKPTFQPGFSEFQRPRMRKEKLSRPLHIAIACLHATGICVESNRENAVLPAQMKFICTH